MRPAVRANRWLCLYCHACHPQIRDRSPRLLNACGGPVQGSGSGGCDAWGAWESSFPAIRRV